MHTYFLFAVKHCGALINLRATQLQHLFVVEINQILIHLIG